MHDVLAGHVEHGELPGLVTLVSRHGEMHVDAVGRMAVGGAEPMRRDTIFRIASMTKPIVAVAAMILVEECRLRRSWPSRECWRGSTPRSTTQCRPRGRSPCATC
jgi:hypothetical protein